MLLDLDSLENTMRQPEPAARVSLLQSLAFVRDAQKVREFFHAWRGSDLKGQSLVGAE